MLLNTSRDVTNNYRQSITVIECLCIKVIGCNGLRVPELLQILIYAIYY